MKLQMDLMSELQQNLMSYYGRTWFRDMEIGIALLCCQVFTLNC